MRTVWRWVGAAVVLALLAGGAQAAKTTGVTAGTNYWDDAAWTNGLPAVGDTVIISGTKTVILLTNATPELERCIVTNGAKLQFENWNTALIASDVVVYATAILTHTNNTDTTGNPGTYEDWTPNARVYVVCTNFTLMSGGLINADDVGYYGGFVGGAHTNGYGPGGGFGGPSSCCGAGYGGDGYNVTTVYGRAYGSADAPEDPGSGGGGRTASYAGGNGGGAVRIDARGAVRIDGTVSASSTVFYNAGRYAGAGSGGSIYITCRTFHGAGTLKAEAVSMEQGGSAGAGGGRICVKYDPAAQDGVSPQPTVEFSSHASRHNSSYSGADYLRVIAGQGSLYLSNTKFFPYSVLKGGYQIVIPGFTNYVPDSLVVDNARVIFPSNCVFNSLTNDLTLRGPDARLDFTGNLTVGRNLTITNYGRLFLYSNPTNVSGPNYGGLLDVVGTALIGSYGTIHPASDATNGGSMLLRAGQMIVATNGFIDANYLGYAAGPYPSGQGYGPGGGPFSAGNYNSGGGHGGAGGMGSGTGPGGVTNDSLVAPISPGSGGGTKDTGSGGGVGGGLVRIESLKGRVVVDGTIRANGGPSYTTGYNGSGAGGGIYIQARTFGGTGTLQAQGGSATSYRGAGGGGGRIAVHASFKDGWAGNPAWGVTVSPQVAGGLGDSSHYDTADNGATGTVYWAITPIPEPGIFIQLR